MNTLLPNLNAAPLVPTAPANVPSLPNFQADPVAPSDQSQTSQSFTQAMAKADADRTAAADNANQVAQQNAQNAQNAQIAQNAQNAQEAQNAQNVQAAQNTQNAQNAQSAQNAQDAQSTQSTSANQSSAAAPATASKSSKAADQTKADKENANAGDADKASSELLALVAASQATSKMHAHAQATAAPALPVAAPVTAQVLPTGSDTKNTAADATAALTRALPDAWNAQAGKDKTTAKNPSDMVKAANDPTSDTDADAGKAAVKNVATGKTDAANAPQLNAAASNAAPTAALNAPASFNLQALTANQGENDNAMLTPALQQMTGTATQAVAGAGAAADKLAPAVGSTDWDEALGQKMVWMSSNGQQSATLTLNPRDLGPMQVVINVNKTQADATFIAATPEVKQALEAAMPKLREMMDQAGIQLGQANVSTGMPNQNQQAFNQPQSGNRSGNSGGSSYGRDNGSGADDTIASGVSAPASGSSGLGLVDTFV
jgi:flagellar hook-length control protein FliK